MEEWKIIKEFPKYEVSNLGRVRKIKSGKVIFLKNHPAGYNATPYIEIGLVVSVSLPRPRYLTSSYIAPQEQVVDIVVEINGNNITLQSLPANLDVADQGTINGSLFISTQRDAMNTEINSMRLKSLDIINSVEHHKKVIQDCEVLLQRLNPEFAELKQLKQEIDMLKTLMSEMMSGMKELMAQLKSKESTTKS